MALAHIAGPLGRGLAAGLVGTAAMTLAQRLEMKLTGREASSAPADAVEEVFDIEPRSEAAEQRLSQLTHWAYGTGWGGVRGLLGGLGIAQRVATPVHLALVWGAAAAMLPRIGVAPPVRSWGAKKIASDVFFHGVYALATGLAFEWLDRRAWAKSIDVTVEVPVDESRTVMEGAGAIV